MNEYMDFYQRLGVDNNASLEEIKSAYKHQTKIFHPDAGGSKEDMQLLNEAYAILSSPILREKYNNELINCGIDIGIDISDLPKTIFTVDPVLDGIVLRVMKQHIENFFTNHSKYNMEVNFKEFKHKYFKKFVIPELDAFFGQVGIADHAQININDENMYPLYSKIEKSLEDIKGKEK